MELSKKKIQALINLLDDPHQVIQDTVTKNILLQGESIIPDLEEAWENSPDSDYQDRLIWLIQEIQNRSTNHELSRWIKTGYTNLLEGAYLVARYQYPDLRYVDINSPLEKIRQDVWLELNSNLTALEKVRVLNHIFFDVHKFSGNPGNLYSPRNSFINQVLETKKGNPVSLAILYSELAQRLGLPVYGVNLPRNFILAYKDQEEDILFYINPYKDGAVLGKKEIDFFLKQQKLETKKSYYYPCSNLEILVRMLQNLINAFTKLGYLEKVSQFKSLMERLEDKGTLKNED